MDSLQNFWCYQVQTVRNEKQKSDNYACQMLQDAWKGVDEELLQFAWNVLVLDSKFGVHQASLEQKIPKYSTEFLS